MWESQLKSYNWAHHSTGLSAYNSIYLNRVRSDVPKVNYAEIFFKLLLIDYSNMMKD